MLIENKNRKIGLDILKFIVAFLVICIHAPFEGEFGKYLIAIARCAVPVFFMITGFFYNEQIDSSKSNKQILKVLKLCIFSNILYIMFQMIIYLIDKKNPIILFNNIFNRTAITNFILYNNSPVYFHLWYLNSLLYVLVVMKFVNKYKFMKYMYIVTPVLLMLDLIYGKYSLLLLHKEIPYIHVRNFLFVGIPYFCIGNYINKKIYNKIKEKDNRKYIFLIIVFVVSTILERYLLIEFNINATRDHYISTTFLSTFLFLYFLLYKNNGEKKNKYENFIAKIGREYSLLIYIIHPAVIEILNRILINFKIYKKEYPIFIFVFTLILCICYKKIYSIINKKNILIFKYKL